MADAWIFISYRRADSQDVALRLAEALRKRLGNDRHVCIDVNLPSGAVVSEDIIRRVQAAGVVLVVIGPDWLTIADADGRARLSHEDDLVRGEIETALRPRTRPEPDAQVIPVLVDGATMPRRAQLKAVAPDIERLADIGAAELHSDWRWTKDVVRLAGMLRPRPTPGRRLVAFAQRHRALLAAGAVIVLVGAAVGFLASRGNPSLTIYSSWPQRRARTDGAPGVVRSPRTSGMQDAMRMALDDFRSTVPDFDIAYVPLDDSDDHGESPRSIVEANARKAAGDDSTAAYVGDFTTDATQQSIPILSAANVPQISISSTAIDPRIKRG